LLIKVITLFLAGLILLLIVGSITENKDYGG